MVNTRRNNRPSTQRNASEAQKVTTGRRARVQVEPDCRNTTAEKVKHAKKKQNAKKRAADIQQKSKQALNQPQQAINHPNDKSNGPRQYRSKPISSPTVRDGDTESEIGDGMENQAGDLENIESDTHPSDDDYEEEDDLEYDEPDTRLSKVNHIGSRSKVKTGVRLRQDIDMAAAMNEADKENTGGQSLSVTSSTLNSGTPKHLKATHIRRAGVLLGWENQAISHPVPTTVPATRAQPATPAPAVTGEDDEGEVHERGIPSSDDEEERLEVPDRRTASRYGSQSSNIQVTDIQVRSQPARKRIRPKHRDLPPGTEDAFKTIVMARVYDHMGASEPWTRLDEDRAADIWNSTFPDRPVSSDVKSDGYKLFTVVYKLMCRDIQNNWIHGLAAAGMKAVQDELHERGLVNQHERAVFVKKLIGDTNNIHTKNHPFLWLSTYEEDEPSVSRGLFRGNLITRTLSYHVDLVATNGRDDFIPSSKPKAALVLAILSTLRALVLNMSGMEEIPSGYGRFFSRMNWGDIDVYDPTTHKRKRQVRHSFWNKDIEKLKPRIWKLILEDASKYSNLTKDVDDEMEVEMDNDVDSLLYDPDQDSD